MKLGIFYPSNLPFSIRNYIDNIISELKKINVEIICFSEQKPLPENVDIYWDPRSTAGVAPYKQLGSASEPVVVTIHGVAPFALPAREVFPNLKRAIYGKVQNWKKLIEWRSFRTSCAAIITISNFSKSEIEKHLKLNGRKIVAIYHGVNHKTFHLNGEYQTDDRSYFLHVSQYQPKKNVNRIIAAYEQMLHVEKPRLIMVASGYPDRREPEGVEIFRMPVTDAELTNLYRGAMGFLFPSLHEGFGMPILEAMAFGCPVITSNKTACAEVAGEAALLVNPRSVREIAQAMDKLLYDSNLCSSLREKGLARAREFTWRKSAEKHLMVFEGVLSKRGKL